jgi:Fe2+ or Zn2+ uptake regulation protein
MIFECCNARMTLIYANGARFEMCLICGKVIELNDSTLAPAANESKPLADFETASTPSVGSGLPQV